MREWPYSVFYSVFKTYFVRRGFATGLPPRGTPVVFIANHERSFGPLSAMSTLPRPLCPWVAREITDPETCPAYIEKDFVVPEVGLRRPLSSLVAGVIGRICVGIMRDIHAIPVYKESKRIVETLDMSSRLLALGKRLLIFPEIPNRFLNDVICEFDTGFAGVARVFFERTKRIVNFLPVAVNRRTKSLLLGAPVPFNPLNSFKAERARLKEELERRICELYRRLERGGSRSSPGECRAEPSATSAGSTLEES